MALKSLHNFNTKCIVPILQASLKENSKSNNENLQINESENIGSAHEEESITANDFEEKLDEPTTERTSVIIKCYK